MLCRNYRHLQNSTLLLEDPALKFLHVMLLQIKIKRFNMLKLIPSALICNAALSPQPSVSLFDFILDMKAL